MQQLLHWHFFYMICLQALPQSIRVTFTSLEQIEVTVEVLFLGSYSPFDREQRKHDRHQETEKELVC